MLFRSGAAGSVVRGPDMGHSPYRGLMSVGVMMRGADRDNILSKGAFLGALMRKRGAWQKMVCSLGHCILFHTASRSREKSLIDEKKTDAPRLLQ